MKQSERNRTCPITQSYLNKNNGYNSGQPARRVRRHTFPDVLNQAFIYPNSNDYRRKRISNQFDATPVARRGRLDPSDNSLNQGFIESRPTRGNHSKPSSDVLNTAMYQGRNFQSRKRTSNQYVGPQHVNRGNSYQSKNIADRSYIEPRRFKENLRPSDNLNNQAYKYPRSNDYKTTRPNNQLRENLRSPGNYSTVTGRDVRPTKRPPIEPSNTRYVPNTYSNLNKVQRNGYSEQWNRRPSTARGLAPLLTEQCTKSQQATPPQRLSFRVQCTPQVSALKTSNDVTCSRSFHEALLCHLAKPSATNQTFSPKEASPNRKKAPGTMPTINNCKSVPPYNQKSGKKADGSNQSSEDAEDDCFDDFKELFPELHVELPKDFWTDPSKKVLLRAFLEDLKQEDTSDNLSENVSNSTLIKSRLSEKRGSSKAESTTRPITKNKVQNVDKNDEEKAKRKALFIKHVRNDLKEKIPQLQLVVKMLELVMSWKKMKQRSKKGSLDELSTSKRSSVVDPTDEKLGWCYCNKVKPDQRSSQTVIKREVTTPETVKTENFALKPEPSS